MDLAAVSSIQDGFQEVYLLCWPIDVPLEDGMSGQCMVVVKREGGVLLAVPLGFIPTEALQAAAQHAEQSLLGPHTVLTIPSARFLDGQLVPTEESMDVQVVDVSLDVLLAMRPFVLGMELQEPMVMFGEEAEVLPDPTTLLAYVREWITVAGQGRAVFYSAEEPEMVEEAGPTPKVGKAKQKAKAAEKAKKPSPQQVAEQIQSLAKMIPAMAQTLAVMQEEQTRMKEAMEGVAMSPPPRASQAPVAMSMQAFAKVMGQPPKVRGLAVPAPPPPKAHRMQLDSALNVQEQAEESEPLKESSSLALAVLEQSKALTSLVSQLSSGDPLLDHQATGATTSSKGAQGREKLMRELADRSSDFCLTVAQNAYRRMKPASKAPATLQEISQTDFSMLSYLERFGGYGGARDVGIMQYAMSFIMDCAIREDLVGVQEYAALFMVGLEQAAQDQGRWDLAFQLMLLEDPPSQMWSYRGAGIPQTGRARAFAPLCPQRWATVALAYAKEIDFIQSKRLELSKRTPTPAPAAVPTPNPKKKPTKFPKAKQSAGGGQASGDSQEG